MKLNGKKVVLPTKKTLVLTLSNDETIEIKIGALPIDFAITIAGILTQPKPPATGKFVKDKEGKPIVINGSFVPEYDENNPKYQKELSEYFVLYTICLVYEVLKNGGNEIEYQAEQEHESVTKDFLYAILKEMEDAGFTLNMLNKIVDTAKNLNNFNGIEAVSENFSQ